MAVTVAPPNELAQAAFNWFSTNPQILERPFLKALPIVSIEYGSSKTPNGAVCRLPSSYDSGAQGNLGHTKCALELIRSGVISPTDVFNFAPPYEYRSGNGGTFLVNHVVLLSVRTPDLDTGKFAIVLADCIPERMFLGHEAMLELGLLNSYKTSWDSDAPRSQESNPYQPPAFQSFAIADLPDHPIRDTPPSLFCTYDIIPTDDPGKNRIMVRMPMLENVLMDVTRMRHSNRSPNYEARALIVSLEMVRKGHCKEVKECDMTVSHNFICVDKKAVAGIRTVIPDNLTPADILARFRGTLDCEMMNLLRFLQNDKGQVFAVPAGKLHSPGKALTAPQHQASGLQAARQLPHGMRKFACDDIKGGFQCLLIHESLYRLFGFTIFDKEENKIRYFLMTTLPQGFNLASTLFRCGISCVVDRVYEHPLIKTLIEERKLAFGNNTDDFLTAASDEATCQLGVSVLRETLSNFGFVINTKKSIGPCDKVIFSGIEITAEGQRPCPTRRKLTEAFAEEMWSQFRAQSKNRKLVVKWLRSICGTFQYFKGFIHGPQIELLQVFYDTCTAMERDESYAIPETTENKVKKALYLLTDYVVNGCPPLYLAQSPVLKTVASVIVVDANLGSYSGFLLTSLPRPAICVIYLTSRLSSKLFGRNLTLSCLSTSQSFPCNSVVAPGK